LHLCSAQSLDLVDRKRDQRRQPEQHVRELFEWRESNREQSGIIRRHFRDIKRREQFLEVPISLFEKIALRR
jgi:hypothetical protein